MRKFIVALFVSLVLIAPSAAHSGKTDAAGGHTNHSTGEYHYHHGQPAHQHPGGVCPYEQESTNTESEGAFVPSNEAAPAVVGVSVVAAAGAYFAFKKK